MVSNVLGAQKRTRSQRLQKDPRLDQAGDRFKAKTAEGFNLFIDLAQLWNARLWQIQFPYATEILCTSITLMSPTKSRPNGTPHVMLSSCVRRIGYRLASAIVERELCNAIAARAILRIIKAGVIWAESHNAITILVANLERHSPHIAMVGEHRYSQVSSHISSLPVASGRRFLSDTKKP